MNGNIPQFLLLTGILIVAILGTGGYYFWRSRKSADRKSVV
jgi:LPXTG-motif cell wall-anchored protein